MIEELKEQQVVESDTPAAVEDSSPSSAAAAAPKSGKEENLRLMRERAERAEQRLAELERLAQAKQQQQAPQDDDDFGVDDDSLIEGKHLKKYVRSVKNELKQTKEQLAAFNNMSAEMRLKAKYPDFDVVVTSENIQRLAEQKPSLYRSIMANPDLYDKGEAACEAIKAWVVDERFKDAEKRIEENKAKPRSSASAAPQASDTPLTRVGDYDRRILTEERKAQLRRQVEEARRLR